MQMLRGVPASATATVRSILQQEGAAAFMSGWQASVMRELSYSAIRMGLYDEVKELLAGVLACGGGVFRGVSPAVPS
jgi:hypothetical protein